MEAGTTRGDNINLQGGSDLVETEMVGLSLNGSSPTLGPIRLERVEGMPAPGGFPPGLPSYFDIWIDIALPTSGTVLRTSAPARLESTSPLGVFPPAPGTSYLLTAPVVLLGPDGAAAGPLHGFILTIGNFPDADADGVTDGKDSCPGTPAGERVDALGCGLSQLCLTPDADGDGIPDGLDRCPGTPAGAAVDDGGCSQAQFCGAVKATTTKGKNRCRWFDWRNDEPLMDAAAADCKVRLGGHGTVDDRCVPRP